MAKKTRKAAEITIDINANVAQLAKDMAKVRKELDGFGSKVSSIQKLLAATFTLDVGRTVLPFVQALATSLGTLAQKGEEAGSIADAFQRLGGSAEQISKAKEATLGVVSSFALMQIANEAMLRQVPGVVENFGILAEYGAKVADTLGIDTKEGIERVIDALSSGKKEQLAAVKMTVDTEEAYRRYAEQLGTTADKLSEIQQKEAVQIQFYRQLKDANEALAAPALSVANAQDKFNTALDEGATRFGIAINNNQELTKVWDDLADSFDDVDWDGWGVAAGNFFSTLLSWASYVLPDISDSVKEINRAFSYLFNIGKQGEADRLATKIREVEDKLNGLEGKSATFSNQGSLQSKAQSRIRNRLNGPEAVDAERAYWQQELENLKAQFKTASAGLGDSTSATNGAASATDKLRDANKNLNDVVVPGIRHNERSAKAKEADAEAAKKASKEFERYAASWRDANRAQSETSLKDKIEQSIEALDYSSFDVLVAQLERSVQEGFVEKWKPAIEAGAVSFEEVEERGKNMALEVGNDLRARLIDAGKKAAEETKREYQEAFRNISTSATDLGDAFGVDLRGIMTTLNDFFSEEMGSLTEEIAATLKMTAKELDATVQTIVAVASTILEAKKLDKETKSNKGTGGAIGSSAGAAIGSMWGPEGAKLGAEIGKVIGQTVGSLFRWGAQNASTQARHAFANWLEDQLAQLDAVTLMGRDGTYRTASGANVNFLEGDTGRFNTPGWAEGMNKWADGASSMFVGLGNSLKEMLGITEEVGEQLGYILGENLAGNIDNARLLVYQLGLSFEELSEALLNLAKRGEISWREYAVQIAGLGEAFEPGLKATADLKGAWDQFVGSGGRGMAALKGVRDLAVEAFEDGARTLDQMRERLIAGGATPEEADAFIKALRANGIQTVKEITELSEAQLGSIVGSFEGYSDSIAAKWQKMGQDLEKIKIGIDSLPTEKDIKIRFSAEFDENMQKAEEAGLLEGGTLQPVSSPTPDVSASRVSSPQIQTATAQGRSTQSAKMQSFSINVDARGADAGVEQRVENVVLNYRDIIAQQAASIVMDNQARGG